MDLRGLREVATYILGPTTDRGVEDSSVGLQGEGHRYQTQDEKFIFKSFTKFFLPRNRVPGLY